MDSPLCPACAQALNEFFGTEDSAVLEIELKAYRRLIRRRRYCPSCHCGCVPGIVSAPAPNRLIERGKFGGVGHRAARQVPVRQTKPALAAGPGPPRARHAAGTLAGGLQALAPLFDPLVHAMLAKLRIEQHWHADETRWAVFVPVDGKVGHRWYLWVYHVA